VYRRTHTSELQVLFGHAFHYLDFNIYSANTFAHVVN
jgi:hypothetical protein